MISAELRLRNEIDTMRTDLENYVPPEIPKPGIVTPADSSTADASGVKPVSSAQAINNSGVEPPSSGGRYSVTQMEQLLVDRGMDRSTARKLAAVGMGESGGRPGIDTVQSGLDPDKNNEFSVGLWQINAQAHGDKLRRRGYTVEDLRDPGKNADIAIDVFNEAGGMTPWSVYNNNLYQQFL